MKKSKAMWELHKKAFDSAWRELIADYKRLQEEEEGYYLLWNESDMNAEFRRHLRKHLPLDLRMHSSVTKTYLMESDNNWWKKLDMRYRADFDLVITDKNDIVYAVAELKFPHHPRETKNTFISKLKPKIKVLSSVPKECYSALLMIDGYFHREKTEIESHVKKLVHGTNVHLYFEKG